MYRHVVEGDDEDTELLDAGMDADIRMPVAPGGPDDALLTRIDSRSPVAGLYVRAERLFADVVRFGVLTCVMAEVSIAVQPLPGPHRVLREQLGCE